MAYLPIRWTAPEYSHREKTADWFWAVGIISISLAGAAIIFNNVLLAIFILLGAFTLSLYAHREPSLVEYELNEKGIVSGNTLYTYSSLQSFWVETRHGQPKLFIQSKRPMVPFITILLGDINPNIVDEYLTRYIREEEYVEPLSHKLLEYLGF